MKKASFVVYKRIAGTDGKPDRVVPYSATLSHQSKGWKDGKPYGTSVGIQLGAEIAWPTLYAGHTAWVAERVAAIKKAIQQERARRAARKAGPGASVKVDAA